MRLFLQIVAIFAFALAGSNFTHATELQSADHHNVGHQIADHAHTSDGDDLNDAHLGSDTVLHCGAVAVLLTASHVLAVEPADAVFEYKLAMTLVKRSVSYDLPPPRA